jgi:phosphoribosylformylglycinamidine synthase
VEFFYTNLYKEMIAMENRAMRLYIEKKPGYDVEAQNLLLELRDNLNIKTIERLRIVNRYDISGITKEEYEKVKFSVFSEKNVDYIFEEDIELNEGNRFFFMEYLPGQYDQRADSSCQCIQLLTKEENVVVNTARLVIMNHDVIEDDFRKIKNHCINPVDSRESSFENQVALNQSINKAEDIKILDGFIKDDESKLSSYITEYNLAMTLEDLKLCYDYFRKEERDPSITELRVIDTYWSDHCRHTTFNTIVESVNIKDGKYSIPAKKAYEYYISSREFVYGDKHKDMCLMDIATIGMKELRKRGMLNDLDESEEINACSIEIDVDVDDKNEKWLLMFKNETHNHPTEIEPFGGASTCLGGAIRDPLSGRAYVYQAMRITGSGDPRQKLEDTLHGKLPQRKITLGAAHGYSSYGNQIGLATGQVSELYDEGFIAKRMEVGAVIGAVPKKNVVRENPKDGDYILLIGGRTGRDGCGGATGSSKEHDESSILNCGAEVQKGNPPTERKIQRLFRDPRVSTIIKRCNDFGAGGVSVAIGELTDGLTVDLDLIPKKYEGLDGTELAISESQERMAVVVSEENVETLINLSREENVEATVVGRVTNYNRLRMLWRGKLIVDLSRAFLNTNGAKQFASVEVKSPEEDNNYFKENNDKNIETVKERWLFNLKKLNICSQRGLIERFDSTIGAGTVIMPLGGKYQVTPPEGMAAKIPVLSGETKTASIMTYGYNPEISKWSPFHGAVYAVIEAVTKIVAMGGDYKGIRLSLQEYFEKLGTDPLRWGKPFAALLGAFYAQKEFEIPAIGGKDSMSGTFKDLDVPPTLIAFAVSIAKTDNIISSEFKKIKSQIVLIRSMRDEYEIPDFSQLKKNFEKVTELIGKGKVLSACSIKSGGISEAISKMCFGNRIGIRLHEGLDSSKIFTPDYGSILLEIDEDEQLDDIFERISYELIGTTQINPGINLYDHEISIEEAYGAYESTLKNVFSTKTSPIEFNIENIRYDKVFKKSPVISTAKPRVFIPVFPGTNCEYESSRVFEKAGGTVDTFVFKNLNSKDIEDSINQMMERIKKSQIIMIPGGFSLGDEPDGSGKFIAAVFRNDKVKEAVMDMLKARDGLILGICNGFQALIKLGLLPYGEIRDIDENCPTLTYNSIGRHMSTMVRTKVVSKLSPWLSNVRLGAIHTVPVSHGEGRFVASEEEIRRLIENGQIATQYVDFEGTATYDISHNPNGSLYAVEGITSPDGRILGKMAHSERVGKDILKNIPGEKDQRIFEAGINYFK